MKVKSALRRRGTSKAFLVKLLAALLALALITTSCSNSDEGSTSASEGTAAQETPGQQSEPAKETEKEPAAEPTAVPAETAKEETPKEDATQTAQDGTRIVVDSLGREIEVPNVIKTVGTVSDGLIEEVMISLGVDAAVNTIGSTCLIRDFTYDFESLDGEAFSYLGGMNPANYLRPEMRDQPLFLQDGEMNFETLAIANPDVLIIHSGCCSVKWKNDVTAMEQTLDKLDKLGVPTVVVHGPNYSGEPSTEALKAGIEVIGDVFDKKDEAGTLGDFVESQLNLVSERTATVADGDKARVMIFGLNPKARARGGAGTTFGTNDVHSFMLKHFVNAENVYNEATGSVDVNAEQVLAFDPEVLLLPTWNGYHPPRELVDTEPYQNLQSLKAIEDNRIAALPWSPCNCDQRLEMPVIVMTMAKTTYPELFEDIDLEVWMQEYFMEVYKVDKSEADGIIDALWMDWARSN